MKLVITMSRRFGTGASIIAKSFLKGLTSLFMIRHTLKSRFMITCMKVRPRQSASLQKNHVLFWDGARLTF